MATLAAAAPARASTLYTPVVTTTGCTSFWSSFQGVTVLWLPAEDCWFQTGNVAFFANSRLALQTDGNLVIYAIDSCRAAWDSHSYGAIGSVHDLWVHGELTIYRYQSNGLPAPIWWAGTGRACGPPSQAKYLAFQSDGNMVIYCRNLYNVYTYVFWATGTWMH